MRNSAAYVKFVEELGIDSQMIGELSEEEMDVIDEVLKSLPSSNPCSPRPAFAVISLRYGFEGEGLTYKQIAEKFDVTPPPIRGQIGKVFRLLTFNRSRNKNFKIISSLFDPAHRNYHPRIDNTVLADRIAELEKEIASLKEVNEFLNKDLLETREIVANIRCYVNNLMTREEFEKASEEKKIKEKLQCSVDELEMSVRSANCLKRAGIETIGELVSKTEAEMLRSQNFGRRNLNELKDLLAEIGLKFGMNF